MPCLSKTVPKPSAKTWCELGHALTALTKKRCYVEALRIESNNGKVWGNLCHAMRAGDIVRVNGERFPATWMPCVEALRHSPHHGNTWGNLAMPY